MNLGLKRYIIQKLLKNCFKTTILAVMAGGIYMMNNIKLTANIAKAAAFTHNKNFTATNIFSTVILSKLFDNFTVCRTDTLPENLPKNVVVYDIGCGKYAIGNECRKNGVPYASCGLIWRDFGFAILEKLNHGITTFHEDLMNEVFSIIDEELFQGIDAVANGELPLADYPAQIFNISQIIDGFNPSWDTPFSAKNTSFLSAVSLANTIFENVLKNVISKANAKEVAIVEQGIKNSKGNIMIIMDFVNWQRAIDFSNDPKAKEILFAICFNNFVGRFDCRCVSNNPFGYRKLLPETWRGLEDKALQEETGVQTAYLCNLEGTFCSAETLEDAIAMAKLAVEA